MNKKVYLVFIPFISIYLWINFYSYVLVDCWVLDEKAFFQSAISFDYGFKRFFLTENKFGYGPFYWWIVSIAHHFNSFKILRLLSFTYLALIPVLIWLIGNKLGQSKIFRIYACLLFITYPSSWVFNKIIGPELLSVFLGILGFYFSLSKQSRLIGFLLTGISFGIKLNSISLFLFSYLFRILTLYSSKEKIQKHLKETFWIGTCSFMGFLISTPIFIIHPKVVIANILSYGRADFFIHSPNHILFSLNHTWDGIINNGLFNIFINIYLLFLFFIFTYRKVNENRILLSFIIASIFLTFQIFSASNYLSWYWFPMIFLSPIVIFSFKKDKASSLFFGLFITLNFILNMPLIFEKIKNRMIHKEILANKNSTENFIKSVENKNPEADFFYFTEFGINPGPDFHVWNMVRGLEKKDSMNGLQKLKNKPKILFLGNRFLKVDPSWQNIVKNDSQTQKFSLRLIDECQYLKAFQILDINELRGSQIHK